MQHFFQPLFLDSIGGGELLVVLFFILIFFGSGKIPELAKGLGKGMRAFRNAMHDVRSDIEQERRKLEDQESPTSSSTGVPDSEKAERPVASDGETPVPPAASPHPGAVSRDQQDRDSGPRS